MSFNIELVPARLLPFDWAALGSNASRQAQAITQNAINGYLNTPSGAEITQDELNRAYATGSASGMSVGYPVQSQSNFSINGSAPGQGTSGLITYDTNHPLYPLVETGGLVFPYTPTISEALGVKYDVVDLTHTNVSIHAFKNAENNRISLSDCVWTSETFDMAVYTLAVIHFFRSYTQMDFGRGTGLGANKAGTGRPPSPMWFFAYGQFLYHQVPVLMERIEFTLPADVDYVGVPNPGTSAYKNQVLQYSTKNSLTAINNQTLAYTWIPMKFTIGSITLVVQHSISYWTKNFNLDDFKAGKLIGRGG